MNESPRGNSSPKKKIADECTIRKMVEIMEGSKDNFWYFRDESWRIYHGIIEKKMWENFLHFPGIFAERSSEKYLPLLKICSLLLIKLTGRLSCEVYWKFDMVVFPSYLHFEFQFSTTSKP